MKIRAFSTIYVTWPALVTVLGGFFAFTMSIYISVFEHLRDEIDARLEHIDAQMLHLDSEVREEIRLLRPTTEEKEDEIIHNP